MSKMSQSKPTPCSWHTSQTSSSRIGVCTVIVKDRQTTGDKCGEVGQCEIPRLLGLCHAKVLIDIGGGGAIM
jgi:hypothetical protein